MKMTMEKQKKRVVLRLYMRKVKMDGGVKAKHESGQSAEVKTMEFGHIALCDSSYKKERGETTKDGEANVGKHMAGIDFGWCIP